MDRLVRTLTHNSYLSLGYSEEVWLQKAESEEQGGHLADMHFVLKDCLWR